jgi:predicted RNA binding protein YcfA (HicA-like mRNA interferase family)
VLRVAREQVRRVILIERSEIDSESLRQPTVSTARAPDTPVTSPLLVAPFGQRAPAEAAGGEPWRLCGRRAIRPAQPPCTRVRTGLCVKDVPKKYRELRAALIEAGRTVVRQRVSHEGWAHPDRPERIIVAARGVPPRRRAPSVASADGLEHLR